MKQWDHAHFTTKEPASLSARMVAREICVADDNADLAWLKALPIAGVIYRLSDGGVSLSLANSRFETLAATAGMTPVLNHEFFVSRIIDMRKSGRTTHFEKWVTNSAISLCQLEMSISCFGVHADQFLISFVDKSADLANRNNLRREMLNDSLTGFPNRVGFEERIEELETAVTAVGGRYTMILFDLARFSRINESVGVIAGDELIITIARRLNARLRANEVVGRIGGNEFALFAEIENNDAIGSIVSRVEQAFVEPCRLSNLEIQIDCAAAAAIGTFGSDDPMETLRKAQFALKRAKKSKRFELFSDEKLLSAKNRFSIETDLRRALDRSELELHYQPLIDLDSGTLTGFEALARWNHPDRGYVSPVDFIAVAEECGLILPLGRWALAEAAQTIAHWDRQAGRSLPHRISVNLSAEQLKRDNVTDAVSDALRAASISGNRFTLELTESALVDDPEGARKKLDSLKQLDACLAMDDFGTGYSNLAYLQKLPIDVLKIDRSFITDMLGNSESQAIVSTILSLASALGMKTTAEGIETEQLSNALRNLGCTVGQGYYYARPLARDAAYAFLMDSVSATV